MDTQVNLKLDVPNRISWMLKSESSCLHRMQPRGKVKTEILAILFHQGNLI